LFVAYYWRTLPRFVQIKKMIRHEQYWRSQTYQLEPMQTCLWTRSITGL
jgi:hypothetical protein